MEPMVEDVMRFLDNVITWFVENAPDEMRKAKYSAMRERSVGLGVMGFHGWLQKKGIPFESPMAKGQNIRFFSRFKECVDLADEALARERGPCPDAAEAGATRRFSCKTAIAPTASISTIANSSPAIEPNYANFYTHKTLDGAFFVKNPYLERLLVEKGKDTHDVWTSISGHKGSVQHLDFLSDWEKEVFKTAIEIDQRWIIEHAADRTPFVDQSQSVNLFLPPNVDKTDLLGIHNMAFRKGLKSLYYLRSESIVGDIGVSKKVKRVKLDEPEAVEEPKKYEECLACT
jgi:ribonucleoside-diphosphate reductase alpha chain